MFNTFALFSYHKNLVFSTVFEKIIFPIGYFGWCPVDHGYIFLNHLTILYSLAQSSSGRFCAGIDHHTTHIFIQPVDGENLTADDFFQCGGQL